MSIYGKIQFINESTKFSSNPNKKSSDYWNEFLEYQYKRIEEKVQKLKDVKEKEKRQKILLSLSKYEIDLIKAEFSNGAGSAKIKSLLINALSIIKEFDKFTKGDILDLLSIAICVNAKKDINKFISYNNQRLSIINNDRLLNYFFNFINSENFIWDNSLKLDAEFKLLNNVIESKNKSEQESLMIQYLNKWYDNHKDYAWYNSHLRNTNTFCGYWSFESSTISKMMNLNEQKLSSNSYFYPLFK